MTSRELEYVLLHNITFVNGELIKCCLCYASTHRNPGLNTWNQKSTQKDAVIW